MSSTSARSSASNPDHAVKDAMASFVGAKNVSRSSRALSASRTTGRSFVTFDSRLREGCVSTISIRVEHRVSPGFENAFSASSAFFLFLSSPGQGQVSQSSKYASASGEGAPTGPQAAGGSAELSACIKRRVSRRSRPRYRFERLIEPEYRVLVDLARLSEKPSFSLLSLEASPTYCAPGGAPGGGGAARRPRARGTRTLRASCVANGSARSFCVWTGVARASRRLLHCIARVLGSGV